MRHPVRAFTVPALLAGIIMSVFWSRPAPVGASPTPSPTAKTAIRLVSMNPWVPPTGKVAAVVRVTGAPAGSTLTPQLHLPVATRSAFTLTTTGRDLPGVEARLGTHPVGHASSTVTVRFTVDDGAPGESPSADTPTAEDAVTLTRAGVYPLTFTVTDSQGAEAASLVAYLVRLPAAPATGDDGRRPLRVATELRVQPPPTLDPVGDPVPSADAVAQTEALTTGVAHANSTVRASLGFAVSPALVDALRTRPDHGRDAPTGSGLATATEGRPLQSLPWSPVDPAGWLATPDLVAPLTRSTEQGDAALRSGLGEPEASLVDLAAWGVDGSRSAQGTRLSEQALRWFVDRGAETVLVPDQSLESLDSTTFPRTLAAPFDLRVGPDRTVRAMQIDRSLSHHFAAEDPTLGANQLIADLSVIALDLPSIARGVVVAPPPGWSPSAAFLSAYVAALGAARPAGSAALIAPTPLTDVASATPPARAAGDTATTGAVLVRSLRHPEAPSPLSGLGGQVTLTDSFVTSLSGMQPGGPARSTVLTRRLRRQMSVAAMPGTTTADRNRRFAAIRAQATSTARSVRLPPRQTITLTSDSASLPVTIRRTRTGPTVVLVHIDAPNRLEFPDGTTQRVTLTEPTTRFDIRVHADSPGDTIIRLTVTSPDSRLVAATTELVVRSTAASGVGLVISFGSLAFLILWWGRDIVRTRRRRRVGHVPPAQLIDIDDDGDRM